MRVRLTQHVLERRGGLNRALIFLDDDIVVRVFLFILNGYVEGKNRIAV